MVRFIAVFIATLSVVVTAWGAEEPALLRSEGVPSSLTLAAAVERALESNPRLRGLGFARSAEQARGEALAFAPAMRLSGDVENVLGTDDAKGADSLEATLSLAGVLELGGKRAARIALADTRLNHVDAERRRARIDLAADVATRYIDAVSAQAYAELAAVGTEITARVLDAATARAAAGRAARAEVAKASIALTRARLDLAAARVRRDQTRTALAALWGADAADFGDLEGDLLRLPPIETIDAIAQRLERNPELELYASQMRIEAARGRIAELAAKTDVGWSAGVRYLEASSDQALVFGIEVPLGSAARAAPARRESAAEAERLRWEADALRVELRATLKAAYAQLEQARLEVTDLQRLSKPFAAESLTVTEQGYANGRYSLLELIDAQRQSQAVTAEVIAAATSFHRLLIDIQHLTGDAVVDVLPGA